MRAIVTTTNGDVRVMKVEQRPDPVPSIGQVLVRVKAAGLNFADILARQGLYPDGPRKPCIMGYEASGVIEDVGSEVDRSLIGKPVIAMTRFNGQAELLTVSAQQVFPKPQQLSFEQAAAIPVNYLTAWALLVVMGGLRKDEAVLIHNAGGGVGLAALDIARHIGAKTFGTASASKHEFLKQRGLDHEIDYRKLEEKLSRPALDWAHGGVWNVGRLCVRNPGQDSRLESHRANAPLQSHRADESQQRNLR